MTDPSEPGATEPEKKPRGKSPVKKVGDVYPGQKIRTKTETEASPFESPDELASRLRREEAREAHELFKEKAVLFAMLVVTGFVLMASSGVLVFSDKLNLQSWAAALTSTLAGYFGWFTGKQGVR